VLEGLPEEKVAKPAWLPTTLRLIPMGEGGTRLSRVARIRMGKAG
jgi:hypothetical protein